MHLLTLTLRQPGTPQVTLYYDDAAAANAAHDTVVMPHLAQLFSEPTAEPEPGRPHPELESVAAAWIDDIATAHQQILSRPTLHIDLSDHHGQRFSCLPHDVIGAMVSDTERLGVVAEERAKQEIALQRKLQAGLGQQISTAMPGIGGLGIGRRQ